LKNYPGISVLLDTIFKVKTVAELKELIMQHGSDIKLNKLEQENIFEINSKFKNKVLFWLSA